MAPAVSVIVPTTRWSDHLLTAVTSVLAQSMGDLELLVVTNRPGIDLSGLPTDPRARALHEPVPGKAAAVNRAATAARGRYLAFLDHDDIWEPHKLERQLTVLAHWDGLPACTTQHRVIDACGGTVRPGGSRPLRYQELLRGRFCFLFSSLVVDRGLFSHLGGLATSYFTADDYDFFLKLASAGEVAFVEECLVRYRVHSFMTTVTQHRLMRREALAILSGQRRLAVGRRDWRSAACALRGSMSTMRHYSLIDLRLAADAAHSHQRARQVRLLVQAAVGFPPVLGESAAAWARHRLAPPQPQAGDRRR